MACASILVLLLSAHSAKAQTWTGANSNDWNDPGNWSGGVPTTGVVTINTTSPNPTVLGVSGAAAATSGAVVVGLNGGPGSLTIQGGSTLTSDPSGFSYIGAGTGAGAVGVVTVTGPGSTWTISGLGNALLLGANFGGSTPTGTLNISNGGAVQTGGDIVVGEVNSNGFLNVTSGGTLTTGRDAYIGRGGGSNGTATITGAGSLWTIASRLFVGNGGPGALTISDNATVDVATSTTVGDSGSSGTLDIASGGTLQTQTLVRGTGPVQVNFDGGTLRAKANTASFVSGFSGTELNIATGGLTIDTAAFNVTASSPFSGVGALTKTGSGTLTLSGANTYSGQTWIQSGTLALSGTGAIASSSRVVADGTFDISDVTPASASIRSLAGSGNVVLGAKTLVLTSANDTFAGSITGTGGLTVSGGTQMLTGSSNISSTSVSGGTLAVNGQLCGDMNVLAGGRLEGTGTVCDTWNWGTIAPGNSIGTIIVAGDFVGNGGLIEIETILGDDTSPTDLLWITGNSSGTANVRVINYLGAGTGGQTDQGIRIIQVDGSSDAVFSLLGDYEFEGEQAVVGGAYAYRLYQGSVSDPLDGHWYLRSTFDDSGVVAPLLQAGAPLYEVYANVLQGFNQLDTLQQRVGNRAWSDGAIEGEGIWGRIKATHGHFDPSTSNTGADYQVSIWELQAGIDGVLVDGEAGQLLAGVNVRGGVLGADVTSIYGDGSIGSTGFGLGATLTWYSETGFYLDGQAQVSWYDSTLTSSTAERVLVESNDGFGYGVSLEAGQKIALGPNWSLTPQAQLAYSEVDFADFTDAFGSAVSLNHARSLKGRLGLSADYENEWHDDAGQTSRTHLYAIANLTYDFAGAAETDLGAVILTSQNEPLRGGLGVGGSYSWGDGKYAVHGEALVDTSLVNPAGNLVFGGTAGIVVKW